MELRAVIKQSEGWWIGWLVDMPGVNAQEKTRNELIESLKICAEEMLEAPYQPGSEEELISIKV
jgi:predicted RNase H-like HicB family nuclease